jgi:peptidylamidoglycolate lyase
MIKKALYLIIIIVVLFFLMYLFQPVKKGKGVDATTQYELVKKWPDLPHDLQLGNPTGIDLDTNQNVVVFHRANREWPLLGAMPDKTIESKTILIIDRNTGKLLNSWGDNLFIMPHGLTVDNENNIWVTDVGLHQVFKFNHEGQPLMKLGEAKVAGNDSSHFNKPTDIAIASDGSFYVSDGYGNSRVIKFSSTGKYLFEWGKKGNKEGEFKIPHGICLNKEGNVFVADRENCRIQQFDSNGHFIKQFNDQSFGNICAVSYNNTQAKLYAVDDFSFLKVKHRGSDLMVFNTGGNIQTRFGRSGSYKGNTCWYHDLAVDNEECIYTCDILGNTIQKFKKLNEH